MTQKKISATRKREQTVSDSVSPKMSCGMDIGQAIVEANRCLLCHDAPCSKACPAGTDPGTFIRKLKLRNITGAVRTIKENNVLGGACGILCPTSRLCEKECSASGLDRPVQIGKIQRALIEHSWETGLDAREILNSCKVSEKNGKVAVIGSGPAGLACAATLARSGIAVTVFEAKKKAGGVLRYGVPSFRLPGEFLDRELEDLHHLGISFKFSTPVKGKKEIDQLLSSGFKAVFVGTGLWQAAKLSDNPQPLGVYSSIEFLEDFRSTTKSKAASRVKQKIVGVIGGGSVAIDCARVALKLGASDVYLIYRRSFAQMPAEPDEKIEALEEGIHFLLLNQPVDYISNKSGALEAVKLIRTCLGEPDRSGRRKPVQVSGSEWTLKLDAVIEAIGNVSHEDLSALLPKAKADPKNLLMVNNENGSTNIPGVFAGGDIVRGPALVVEAINDGKKAGQAILASLQQGKSK